MNAIKKIPINPPLSAPLSAAFTHLLGNVNSKAPKNEIANTIKIAKNAKFTHGFVDISFRTDGPKITVANKPNVT